MDEFDWLQADVRDELKEVRRRGVARFDEPAVRKKYPTPNLEAAAQKVPGYGGRMTPAAAIYLLIEHEVPRVSQPHREWLETMFALPEELRALGPGKLRDNVADSIGEDRGLFKRKGGRADQAITSLAAQIVADCFTGSPTDGTESPDEDNETERPMPEPAPKKKIRVKSWHIAAGLVVVAALVGGAIFLFSNNGDPTASDEPDAERLEARYDGKDPRGLEGKASKCADPPPSQAVPSSTPPVYGPDGQQVGIIELRTSPICPVIWARVLWNNDPNARYQIPAGWTLHVVAYRPETDTTAEFPEPSSSGPVPYGLGPMLTTARGCVYVEAYFTNGNQKTHAVPTSCVTTDTLPN